MEKRRALSTNRRLPVVELAPGSVAFFIPAIGTYTPQDDEAFARDEIWRFETIEKIRNSS